MVNKLLVYQKGMNFVLTRQQENQDIDAEEFLRNLEQAREQLTETKKRIEEFERDIRIMEKLEPIARRIRDEEIIKGRQQRLIIRSWNNGR